MLASSLWKGRACMICAMGPLAEPLNLVLGGPRAKQTMQGAAHQSLGKQEHNHAMERFRTSISLMASITT
jgi:hypothetical protein